MAEQLNPDNDTLLAEPGFHAWLLANPTELKTYVATYKSNVDNAFYKRIQVQKRFLAAADVNSTLTKKNATAEAASLLPESYRVSRRSSRPSSQPTCTQGLP